MDNTTAIYTVRLSGCMFIMNLNIMLIVGDQDVRLSI